MSLVEGSFSGYAVADLVACFFIFEEWQAHAVVLCVSLLYESHSARVRLFLCDSVVALGRVYLLPTAVNKSTEDKSSSHAFFIQFRPRRTVFIQ